MVIIERYRGDRSLEDLQREGEIKIDNLIASKERYRAALVEEWEDFMEDPNIGQCAPMTLAMDTAIHVAVYTQNKKLLKQLLRQNPSVVDKKNAYGNTALHVAAVTGDMEAADLLVKSKPELLQITNKMGETPIFKAAAFGQTKIVKCLASQPNQKTEHGKLLKEHRWREKAETDQGTSSILHIAIEGEHFDTALALLEMDETLLDDLKDRDSMTCLQRLANMPSAFKSGYPKGQWNRILYFCLPSYEDDQVINQLGNLAKSITEKINRSIWKCLRQGLLTIKKTWEAKEKHELALKLAKMLIKKDDSWAKKHTITDDSSLYYSGVVEEENDGQEQGQGECQCKRQTTIETPLLLATRNGIVEIVKEILEEYPQAVEHCSHEGQNILFLAVKYRQKEIFDLVKKMKIQWKMLVRGIDKDGCTLLHHAARFDTKETRPGPALQLQEELKWFNRVQKCIPPHYERHVNRKDKQTAEVLFKKNHQDQLKKAQKWIKETSASGSTVAALIAAANFAVVYTVPGGSNDKGIPIFFNYPLLWFVTIMDAFSLASSLSSVVMFLSILNSPFELQNFRYSLPRKLTSGFSFLFLSVATTMVGFTSTVALIIGLNKKKLTAENWKFNVIFIAALFPVTVFALIQFPLYAGLIIDGLTGSFKKVKKFVSRLFCKEKISTKAKHIYKQKNKPCANVV